jgi:hypothetical protein
MRIKPRVMELAQFEILELYQDPIPGFEQQLGNSTIESQNSMLY